MRPDEALSQFLPRTWQQWLQRAWDIDEESLYLLFRRPPKFLRLIRVLGDCKFEGRVSKEIDRRHRTDNHTHSIIMMDQSAKSAWDTFWWWLSKPHWLHLQIRKSLTRFTYHFYETLFQVCGQAVSTRRLITVRFLVKKKFLRFHLFFSKR